MNDNRWNYDYSTHYKNAQNTDAPQQPPLQGAGYGVGGAQYVATPPNMPVAQPKEKKHTARRVFAFLLALILCGAAGFGGGYIGGSMSNPDPSGNVVISQSVADGSGSTNIMTTDGNFLVSDIASIAAPSVVEVMTEQATMNSLFGQYVTSGAGSGVIISEDGYILTNAHVVADAQQIKITTSDKQEYTAELIGSDTKTDIAVLKIDATGLSAATSGNSDELTVGDFALAVGNPLGTLGGTVTDGIISALDRDIVIEGTTMTMLQTNAAVSPGNSGGGLFNSSGELIGIVTAKSGTEEAEGLGFAIPINNALEVANELINNGYVTGRPVLGVTVVTISDVQTAYSSGVTRLGVYIAETTPGGAADLAGLQPMDYIVSLDGIAVETTTDLTDFLETKAVGDTVNMQVIREGEMLSVDVVLQETVPQSQQSTPESILPDLSPENENLPEELPGQLPNVGDGGFVLP